MTYMVKYAKSHTAFNQGDIVILHEPFPYGEKVTAGKVNQSLDEVPSFEFSLYLTHAYYSQLEVLTGIVQVVNTIDNEVEFFGRILTDVGEMSSDGAFSKSFVCEDFLGYLNDSSQVYARMANASPEDLLRQILSVHNAQVEPWKQFRLGKVTVKSQSNTKYRYTGYDSTLATIKKYLMEQLGGYLRVRSEKDGLYLDYLAEVGEFVDSPIRLGKNIKSSKRELNLDGLLTRIVPIGADADDKNRDEDTGQYTTRRKVTIESVNKGKNYLEDTELVKEFGIIQKSVEWSDISSPSTLKTRGNQYLRDQRIAISSWTVSMVERSLVDAQFKKTRLGNTYPLDNPPLAGIEKLQVISKTIDVLNPQSVEVTIGSNKQSLTAYQLQQREAQSSMQKALSDSDAARKASEQMLKEEQGRLAKEQEVLANNALSIQREMKVELLNDEVSRVQSMMNSESKSLEMVEKEIARLTELDTDEAKIQIPMLVVQRATIQSRIDNIGLLIAELRAKIAEIGGST
ncbi:TPA: phage tail spike protein [Streptococcus suis]